MKPYCQHSYCNKILIPKTFRYFLQFAILVSVNSDKLFLYGLSVLNVSEPNLLDSHCLFRSAVLAEDNLLLPGDSRPVVLLAAASRKQIFACPEY